ncbi:MAG: methyl-accepting chemotaxis protein [Gemmatimonadaceae bacterium]|jgi:methyl-accepting chemotaxis protein|nr:methyl-accepting chemotaxis protein [Gemmatimonadaceae bacterium]
MSVSRRLQRLTLRTRLGAGFGLVVGIFCAFAFLSVRAMEETQDRFRTVFADRVVPLAQLEAIKSHLSEAEAAATNPLLSTDGATRLIEQHLTDADAQWTAYLATWLTPEEAGLANAQKAEYDAAKAALRADLVLRAADGTAASSAARRTALEAALAPSLARFDALLRLQVRVAREEFTAADAAYRSTRILALILLGVAVLCAVGAAWWLVWDVGRAIEAVRRRAQSLVDHCIGGLARASRAMASGDFSVTVDPRTRPLAWTRDDELGALAAAVDGIVAQAQETVRSFGATQQTMRDVIGRLRVLGEAMRAGQLDARVPAEGLQGDLAQVAHTMNAALDGVVRPMLAANDEFRTTLSAMARGDLTVRVRGQHVGVQREIAEAINGAASALERTIGDVAAAADEIAAAGREIAGGAVLAAESASTQAGRLEEVTANANAQRESARGVARDAADARALTRAAHEASAQGTTALRALDDALRRIRTTAEATSKVVRTIDEIAFQTNLLALNAAVEAARAGDAGRGFAVVADEVRALATRSSEAARQTAELIDESLHAVTQGAALGEDAVQGITQVDARITGLASAMDRMADASAEQTRNVDVVVEALEALTDLTTQSAATAQETSAAAEELRGQSEQLTEGTRRFATSRARVRRAA